MARTKDPATVSSDQDGPGDAVAVVEQPDVIGGEIVAAAERAAALVTERGYGPNTTRLIMYIAERSVDESDLNVVITEQLAERLLNAASPDDILMPFDPIKGQDRLGQPLIIEDVTFIESDFEGFPWYASMRCKDPGRGESYVLTVGGEKVVMQVAGAVFSGQLPLYCKISKSEKATKAGFFPLDLRPIINI